ncbi:hypothetical protein [Dactylosporangium maewongense]
MLLLATPLALVPPLLLGTGVHLTLSGTPSGHVIGPVLLIGVISAAWPHRRDRHWQPWIVDRAAAPALFALLDRVAAASSSAPPSGSCGTCSTCSVPRSGWASGCCRWWSS